MHHISLIDKYLDHAFEVINDGVMHKVFLKCMLLPVWCRTLLSFGWVNWLIVMLYQEDTCSCQVL